MKSRAKAPEGEGGEEKEDDEEKGEEEEIKPKQKCSEDFQFDMIVMKT